MDAATTSHLLEDLVNGDFEKDILQELIKIVWNDGAMRPPPPPPQQERQQER